MKYTVQHTCGHTSEVELFGPTKTRETRIAYLAGRDCKDCYVSQVKSSDAELVKEVGGRVDLPPLIGTDKQVEWANAIRAKAYHSLEVSLAIAPDKAKVQAYIDAVMRNRDASWWISHRAQFTGGI